MKAGKLFKDAVNQDVPQSPGQSKRSPRQITGLAFNDKGDQFVTSSDDESFRLYSLLEG